MLSDRERIVNAIHEYFIKNSLTLSVAESCTGGLIMNLITNRPGASRYFVGGVVAYASEIKKSLLNIPDSLIKSHGVISKKTALKMASGIRMAMGTDIGISTTGNLGPDTLEGKDVGLVYFGYSSPHKEITKVNRFTGTREEIKEKAALYSLENLLEFLKG